MRERNFAIKSNYSSLSCLNSGEFIKKTGAKTVFSFISTKEQKLQQSLHKKSAHSVLISASKAPNNRAEEAGKKANSSQKIKTEFGAKQKFILLLSGAFIGMLNGFFGGGGGMVIARQQAFSCHCDCCNIPFKPHFCHNLCGKWKR